VPPHLHRKNAAERVIRTFKNHFVAGLCSVDKQFPMHLWCELLPQATLKGCGILPFDSMFSSDHTPLYVDFDVATLFGNSEIGTYKAVLRYLQFDNPRLVDAYETAICQQFENHNVEYRITNLYAMDTG
jgi:hypothetical protein